jgi:cysteine desulfuration protein SufE
MYPPKLEAIISLFESLPEIERRETLVSYADNAKKQEPRPGEKFALEDVRKDEECADTVGVYLQVDDEGKAHFRMTLGPEVQTLTRAMTAILCKGLDRRTPQEVLELPSDCRRGAGARAQPDDLLRADADQRHLQGLPRPAAHGGGRVTSSFKSIDCFPGETDDTAVVVSPLLRSTSKPLGA